MFNFTDAGPQPLFHSQSLPHSVPVHHQEYNPSYPASDPPSRQPRLVSISRTLQARGHSRQDFDPHAANQTHHNMHHDDMHHDDMHHDGCVNHDSWNSFSDSRTFAQSYHRHVPDSSHLRVVSSVPYHNQAPSVPLQPAFSNMNELSPFVTSVSPTTTPPPVDFSSDKILPAINRSLSEHSDSDFWLTQAPGISRSSPDVSERSASDQAKPRRARRERPRIALAPDQPPTTQGKARARVYVACVQCRTRKIRCDGAKPVCHNCGLRTNCGNECDYDAAPKRRGPDKIPGGRQRRDAVNDLDLENGLPRRRRRRTRESDSSTPESKRPSLEHLQMDCVPGSRPNSSCSVPFTRDSSSDISSTTSEFMPLPDYSRSPYSALGGHPSLTQCADIPGTSGLFYPRKAAPVENYNYHWS